MNINSSEKNVTSGFKIKSRFPLILFLLFTLLILYPAGQPEAAEGSKSKEYEEYMVLIDAGSTGSRIYIYGLEPRKYGNVPGITELDSKDVEPGISDYCEAENKIRENIDSLIKRAEEKVPDAKKGKTKLYVLATAGMRLINENKAKMIINIIENFLKEKKFNFKGVKVISGKYEGLYGWLAINYLDDRFDPRDVREGLLEMGGASTQIAYGTNESSNENIEVRELRFKKYNIFCKSYLGLGSDEFRKDFEETESCFPVGFKMNEGEGDREKTGTGCFCKCEKAIDEMLEKTFTEGLLETDTEVFIAISSFYYNFSGIRMPEIIDPDVLKCVVKDFCATKWDVIEEDYKRIFKNQLKRKLRNELPLELEKKLLLKLNEKLPIKKLTMEGLEKMRGELLEELKKKFENELNNRLDMEFKKNIKFLKNYCFNVTYFWSLLTNYYNFKKGKTLIIQKNKIDEKKITWTIGAAIDIYMGNEPEEHKWNN